MDTETIKIIGWALIVIVFSYYIITSAIKDIKNINTNE